MSEHPAYDLRLSVRDLARVGLLMARSGRWNGRQIVSQQWVAESTRAYSSPWPGVGYGYLWWVSREDGPFYGQRFPGKVFSAEGNFGQYIIVDPVRDLVIVHRVHAGAFHADVTPRHFVELLGRILAAAPAT
jgi:CubicO group peptidase (beta-lactamase class C family)